MEKPALQDSSQKQHGLADTTVHLPVFPVLPAPSKHDSILSKLQVVHEWSGYTTKGWALAIYRLLVVLTGGLVWVITQYRPQTCLWMMQKCSLSTATYVYVKVMFLFCLHGIPRTHTQLVCLPVQTGMCVCMQLINGRQELLKVQEMPSLCRSHSFSQQVLLTHLESRYISICIQLLMLDLKHPTHASVVALARFSPI